MENLFWDRKESIEDIKNILKDDSDKEFIPFAALLLRRTTNSKSVFSNYLDEIRFCKNWRKIKRRMRKDEWRSPNINFWDEVYKVVVEKNKDKIQRVQKRDILKKPELGNFIDIIKKRRGEHGWTQKELAERAELSQQTISLMESGKFNFSVKSLIKILKALDLEVELRPSVQYFSRVDSNQAGSIPIEYVDDKPQPENVHKAKNVHKMKAENQA
jgi:transcriptional regulator with XRE-family HTH domain